MKQYKGNNISEWIIAVLFILVVSAFTSCAPQQKSFNNSGEACHKYYHKSFKTFNK